jgi:DMSO/TMAO reductase YedYZ molybdopterin-dependent catalytic subunit
VPNPTSSAWSRRSFLAASLAASGLALSFGRLLAQQVGIAGGRLLGSLELDPDGAASRPPFGVLLGTGLDARLFTDLSTLTSDTLITSNDRFFIRTASPDAVSASKPWTIELGGRVRKPRVLAIDALKDLVRAAGVHLLECSGNADRASFGMLSAALWSGIPLDAILDRVTATPGAPTRILISGVDDLTRPSSTSVPGASWIFQRDELERTGAFLATTMNGVSLPHHHGFPVRLIVPGWYGCSCIKWVNRIEFVPDESPATSQMIEFASRTHQNAHATLARDFTSAVIDLAAMPIRVEKWQVDGRLVYRVTGVMWGGSKPTQALQIRFRSSEAFVPVSDCPLPATTTTWSLWSHLWRPAEPRRYQIVLRVNDPAIRTRRLDLFFYTREVVIDEV